MNASSSPLLSIILPIYNAELLLRERVAQLLELAAAVGSRVELLIIDRESTDGTLDVALELDDSMESVHVLRRAAAGGWLSARTGSLHTFGDAMLIHDVHAPLSSSAIEQFWIGSQQGPDNATIEEFEAEASAARPATHRADEPTPLRGSHRSHSVPAQKSSISS